MTSKNEPAWVPLALVASLNLLALSVGWGFVPGTGGAGGDGGFVVLGEFITIVLWCCCGVVLAWLLAGAAALNKSRAGLWLLALETPFLLYAFYWLVLLLSGA
jgi:hypothetical protein